MLFGKKEHLVGLDIGSRTIKAAEIAETKKEDLNANDTEMAMRIIEGTARSMGIEVKG